MNVRRVHGCGDNAGDALSGQGDARLLRVLWRKHVLVAVKANRYTGSGMDAEDRTVYTYCSLMPQ